MEKSRAPKSCPHKTPAGLEGQIVKLRRQTGFGAERLVQEFDLKVSHNAVARIIRAHKLTRPRKKKPATKKQLRSLKKEWRLFGQLTADTKYLQDIPNYWPQMMRHRLPRFQYTAREIVSGACFAAYADELSKSYAVFMAEQLSAHLALYGVDLSTLVWQTDNGGETHNKVLRSPLLHGAQHGKNLGSVYVGYRSMTKPREKIVLKPPEHGISITFRPGMTAFCDKFAGNRLEGILPLKDSEPLRLPFGVARIVPKGELLSRLGMKLSGTSLRSA